MHRGMGLMIRLWFGLDVLIYDIAFVELQLYSLMSSTGFLHVALESSWKTVRLIDRVNRLETISIQHQR